MRVFKFDKFRSKITGNVYNVTDAWGELLGYYVLGADGFEMELSHDELMRQFEYVDQVFSGMDLSGDTSGFDGQ